MAKTKTTAAAPPRQQPNNQQPLPRKRAKKAPPPPPPPPPPAAAAASPRDCLSDLLVEHSDLSGELLTFLDSRAIAALSTVLRFNKRACPVLEDERRWRTLLKLRCGFLRSQLQRLKDNVFVVEGDLGTITSVNGFAVDCLAFPTSFTYRNPGVGVAARVHERAGPELDVSISARDTGALSWPPGNVLCTLGYNSGVNLLVHCAGPASSMRDCDRLLHKVYTDALCKVIGNRSVTCAAFASISTGRMAFPVNRAAAIAMRMVRDAIFRCDFDTKIAFVCFEKHVYAAFVAAQRRTLRAALTG